MYPSICTHTHEYVELRSGLLLINILPIYEETSSSELTLNLGDPFCRKESYLTN